MSSIFFHTEQSRKTAFKDLREFSGGMQTIYNYDLRGSVFMSCAVFDKRFQEDKRAGRSSLLDRGTFGKETFDRFVDYGDYLITWVKNCRGGGWEEKHPRLTL